MIEGLSEPRKTLPCRFFYDARGSELFEEITRLPEYYPTRTEAGILAAHAAEMAEGVPGRQRAGRVRLGLEPQDRDPARAAARRAAPTFRSTYRRARFDDATQRLEALPALDVRPIVGDFSHPLTFPLDLSGRRAIGFFPGSTIGNLAPAEAVQLLRTSRRSLSAPAAG